MITKQKILYFSKRADNDFNAKLTSSLPYGLAAQLYSLGGNRPFSGKRNK